MDNPNRPLTTNRIAFENIRRKPFRTWGQILVVAVFAFVLFCGSVLSGSIRSGMESMSKRLGADLMIVPYGYDKQLQSALLRGEPGTFYLDESLEEKIRAFPGVENVSSQIFIASLQAACCSVPVQLIGFDQETDAVIQPWIAGTLHKTLQRGEVIVGHKVTGKVGERITFFGKSYRIAARLDNTGMGFDTSVFVTHETARQMISKLEIAPLFSVNANHPVVSTMMVNVKPGFDSRRVANDILFRYASAYNLDIVMTKNMFSEIALRLNAFSYVVYGISGSLWIMAMGVMALVFSMIVNERKREFSLLRIFGASRGKIHRILMMESLMISVAGALCGLCVAALVLFPFSTLIGLLVKLPFVMPSAGSIGITGLLCLIAAAAIGPLSCLYCVWRLNRSDISFALRGI
ncbi:MAG: ABC transporter permease [Oxalobacter sp.]|nr:ABC transporter permease [Oxalobacter sp.]